MLDLVPIWKDRGINKDLKMKLVRSLVWTVLTYGAEGWTLKKADVKRIESAEMWIYRRMLRVSWTEHRTDESILLELNTTKQLLGFVVRRKLYYTQYSSNSTKWMNESMELITRDTRDRDEWRRLIRCAARAADHHS